MVKKFKFWRTFLHGTLIAVIITELVYFYQVVSGLGKVKPLKEEIREEFILDEKKASLKPEIPARIGAKHKALLEINVTTEGPEAFIEEIPAGNCVESYRRKVVLLKKSSMIEPLCVWTTRPEISFEEYKANFTMAEDDSLTISGKMYLAQINTPTGGADSSFIYLITWSVCDSENPCESYYAIEYTSTLQSELSFSIPGHTSFLELNNFTPVK